VAETHRLCLHDGSLPFHPCRMRQQCRRPATITRGILKDQVPSLPISPGSIHGRLLHRWPAAFPCRQTRKISRAGVTARMMREDDAGSSFARTKIHVDFLPGNRPAPVSEHGCRTSSGFSTQPWVCNSAPDKLKPKHLVARIQTARVACYDACAFQVGIWPKNRLIAERSVSLDRMCRSVLVVNFIVLNVDIKPA